MNVEQKARELLAEEFAKSEETKAAARRIQLGFPTDVEKAALRAIAKALQQGVPENPAGARLLGWISERDADDLSLGRGLAGACIYPTINEGCKNTMPANLVPIYAGAQQGVPEGWRVVPVEPTDEMVWAGKLALSAANSAMRKGERRAPVTEAWQAMLAAAPQPPAKEG